MTCAVAATAHHLLALLIYAFLLCIFCVVCAVVFRIKEVRSSTSDAVGVRDTSAGHGNRQQQQMGQLSPTSSPRAAGSNSSTPRASKPQVAVLGSPKVRVDQTRTALFGDVVCCRHSVKGYRRSFSQRIVPQAGACSTLRRRAWTANRAGGFRPLCSLLLCSAHFITASHKRCHPTCPVTLI